MGYIAMITSGGGAGRGEGGPRTAVGWVRNGGRTARRIPERGKPVAREGSREADRTPVRRGGMGDAAGSGIHVKEHDTAGRTPSSGPPRRFL